MMHAQSNPHTIFDPRQILDQQQTTPNLGPNFGKTSTHANNSLTHVSPLTHPLQFSRLQINYPEVLS